MLVAFLVGALLAILNGISVMFGFGILHHEVHSAIPALGLGSSILAGIGLSLIGISPVKASISSGRS